MWKLYWHYFDSFASCHALSSMFAIKMAPGKNGMSNRTPSTLSLVIGLGLLVGAGYMFNDTRQLISSAEKTPGIVVDFERRSSKGGSSSYPVIEYDTASGAVRRFTTSGAGNFTKGEKVEVLYDAGDPAKARVNVFIELWLGSLALGAFGLLCLGVGIGTLLYERACRKSGGENGLR